MFFFFFGHPKCDNVWKFQNRLIKELFVDFDKQGESEGFDSCDWHSNLAQIESNSYFFADVTMKFDG